MKLIWALVIPLQFTKLLSAYVEITPGAVLIGDLLADGAEDEAHRKRKIRRTVRSDSSSHDKAMQLGVGDLRQSGPAAFARARVPDDGKNMFVRRSAHVEHQAAVEGRRVSQASVIDAGLAEAAGFQVQTEEAIRGHTALGSKTIYTVALDDHNPGNCSASIQRAMTAIKKHIAIKMEQHIPVEKEITIAAKALENALVTGTFVLDEVDEALSKLDMRTWIQTGTVWTATDQNNLVSCSSKHAEKLEDVGNGTIDGTAVVQGDMLAGGGSSLLQIEDAIDHGRRWAGSLWPDGQIKYCFHSSATKETKDTMAKAISHVMTQVPCVKFSQVELAATGKACAEVPSVIVKKPGNPHCASWVGMQNTSQDLLLGSGCEILGIVAHEIGHLLGMVHEQNRPDRDKYITIHKDNIVNGAWESNFPVWPGAHTGSKFDMLSLMMYDAYAFSANKQMTVEPHDLLLVPFFGQRIGFSQMDVEQIGMMYGCPTSVTPSTENKEEAEKMLEGQALATQFDGDCRDKEVTGFTNPASPPEKKLPAKCSDLVSYCFYGDSEGDPTKQLTAAKVKKACPVSCYQCIPSTDIFSTTMSYSQRAYQAAQDYWMLILAGSAFFLVVVVVCGIIILIRVRPSSSASMPLRQAPQGRLSTAE